MRSSKNLQSAKLRRKWLHVCNLCAFNFPYMMLKKIIYCYVLDDLLVRLGLGRAMIVYEIGAAEIANKVSFRFIFVLLAVGLVYVPQPYHIGTSIHSTIQPKMF